MTWRRPLAAGVLLASALALLVLAAGPAQGHAVLIGADPEDEATLEAPPETVRLQFNEPVETPGGDSVRVFDANADRVDEGLIDTGDEATVSVALPDDLDDGGYVVSWRVVSLDSHVVGGVLSFTVGDVDAVGDDVIAEVAEAGDDVDLLASLVRGLTYLGVLLAAGGLAFAWAVARDQPDREAARRLAVPAALAALVITAVAVPVQAAEVGAIGLRAALTSPDALAEVLDSGFGVSAIVRATALAALAFLWWLRLPAPILAAPAAAALGSFLLDGHQRTVEPAWLLLSSDAVHLAAGATWFAGLVLLAGALRRRRATSQPLETARLVVRFSTLALVTALLVVVSGGAMTWALVRTPGGLVDSGYGWTLLGKLTAVTIALGLAAYNRYRLVPGLIAHAHCNREDAVAVDQGGDAADQGGDEPALRERLTTTLRVEALVLVLVVLLTGALVVLPPPAATQGMDGIFQESVPVDDDLDLDIVVEPGQVGRNTLHFYALEQGQPSDRGEGLTVELTYLDQGIGPIEIEPFPVGPGHWMITGDELAFAGTWELTAVFVEDQYTRHRLTVEFTID